MTTITIDRAPASRATAVKNNLYAMFEYLGQSDASTIHSGEYGFRWRTSVAHPWFNGVLSKMPAGQDAAQLIQDAVAYFRNSGVTSFSWWLAPDIEPRTWLPPLRDHNFQYSDQTPGMAIDLAILPAITGSRLKIRRVEDRSMLTDYSRTLVRGFGMADTTSIVFSNLLAGLGLDEEKPLRHYLGYLDGEPVATSALFLGFRVAGIYNVATLPAARGRGIASAMTLAPLHEARAMGFETGILQSSSMGHHVYQRLGFETVCKVDYFYRTAP